MPCDNNIILSLLYVLDSTKDFSVVALHWPIHPDCLCSVLLLSILLWPRVSWAISFQTPLHVYLWSPSTDFPWCHSVFHLHTAPWHVVRLFVWWLYWRCCNFFQLNFEKVTSRPQFLSVLLFNCCIGLNQMFCCLYTAYLWCFLAWTWPFTIWNVFKWV